MIKVAFLPGQDERGLNVVPLFGPADAVFEKVAAPTLLPEVARYIGTLKPQKDSQYVLLNAMGAGEWWGCFPAGTLIRTARGETPIEQITVGTEVRTHRNRLRRVQAVQPKTCNGLLADLYVQGLPQLFPALTATPNHELFVVLRDEFARVRRDIVYRGDISTPLEDRRRQQFASMPFDWVSIGELRRGDLVAQPFPLEEDAEALGREWHDPHIAFLLGLYAAEGCLYERYDEPDKIRRDKLRNGRLERPLGGAIFVVGAHEQATIARAVAAASAHGHALTATPDEATHSVRLQLSWQAFAELCKDHIGSGAVSKRLSTAVLHMPRGWQKELFFAYAGGDGYKTKGCRGAGSRRCCSASVGLLVDMRLLLARLGMVGSISGRHNKKSTWYNGNPIFELLVGSSQLLGEGGQAKSYLHPDGFILSAVHHVREYTWEGEVYDLQVEEDRSYTASGISVHNSNINGDYFSEESLIHKPNDWTGNPLLDKEKARDWPYGFPTFYSAHPYCHHRNKNAAQAFGEVELAAWHPRMKRVELVARIDEDKCQQFGGVGVWDKLKAGECPDVSMGCFTAGTRVSLADGSRRPIEEVQVGDLVLTHLGRARRVLAVHQRSYRGDLYSLKAEATPVIRCTRQHPFHVVPENQVKERNDGWDMVWRSQLLLRPEWVHAECLGLSHYALAPIPSECGTEQPSRAFARLLGYYLAEGHPLRNKAGNLCGIELTAHVDDAVHQEIDRLCADFGTKNPPAFAARANSENAVAVYIHDARLAELCARLAGAYSKQKRLAHEVLYWDPEFQLELLGAYANGDGCGSADGSLGWSTSSEALAWQVQLILARSGMLASVGRLHHKPSALVQRETEEWVVHLGKQHASRLVDYSRKIRPVVVLSAKNSRMIGREGERPTVITPIRAIDAIYAEIEVFNLEVEEDESYLVEGLAVHNCKVPFDSCSICLDWDTYRKAQSAFIPGKHNSPGDAVLAYHKELLKKDGRGIRGVSITRKDYCSHARDHMNQILPDGRKAFVYNDYPKFFDISFVFIGADKTAKVMMKIAGAGKTHWSLGGAELAEKLGYDQDDEVLGPEFSYAPQVKAASAPEEALKTAFLGKQAKNKDAEIVKDVVPSQFAGKAVPVLTRSEPSLPDDVMEALCASPLGESLSTPSALGIVLRPREFQRIILVQAGHRPLADKLDGEGAVFPRAADSMDVPMGTGFFSPVLARLLLPLLAARSGLGPAVEQRVLVMSSAPKEKHGGTSSLSSALLRKIGAAYNGYRTSLMDLVAHAQDLIASPAMPSEAHKFASARVEDVFTPLSVNYLKLAFWDEVGVQDQPVHAGVERGNPSRNTWPAIKTAGGQ